METAEESLVSMGFPENRVKKALAVTGHQGIELAMEWILEHQNDPDIDKPYEESHTSAQGGGADDKPLEDKMADQLGDKKMDDQLGDKKMDDQSDDKMDDQSGDKMDDQSGDKMESGDKSEDSPEGTTASTSVQQVMSIKCEECGKLLRSDADIASHVARTGHTQFAESTQEIKPLTEEEKKEKLKQLEARLQTKRTEREERERQTERNREKIRRKTGQELTDIKQKRELQEAKKLAEERKREKMEDLRARQKVKEQIARDRADKAARLQAEKQQGSQAAAQPTPPPATVNPVKKDYDSCRLQIRCFDGQMLTNTFKATETLVEVNRYIMMNRGGDNLAPFSLMSTFPKKVYSTEDMNTSLKDLGLVPSAALSMTQLK